MNKTLADASTGLGSRLPQTSPADQHALDRLVGRRGVAETDLRLAGKAKIDGETHDVVSDHAYIDRGTPITVVKLDGPRMVVAAIVDQDAPSKDTPA